MSAHSPAKAWARALEMTTPIARNPGRTFSTVIEELAEKSGDAPALLSDRQCLSYRELNERANRYARWALGQRLAKGQTVALLMPNRPEYLAIWLGITRVGGVVALLNTNLSGPSLARCIEIVAPKHVIAAVELMSALESALPHLSVSTHVWAHGAGDDRHPRIDADLTRLSGDPLADAERVAVTISDRALYIYTSGTTGLPKAANISQGRLMQWSHWFAGLMNTEPSDRMYNCLPMYHSVGGVLATGALLVAGGSVFIRESFSASQFWDDVIRWECTLFQNICEICR
jgi:fatty-acyl-CoA synthase